MRNHIRSNVIGYVALFFALSSNALAANTVFSEDIVNGEVKTADLATVAVTGPKIRADAVINDKVSATAVLDNHSGGVAVTRVGAVGAGQYEVDFGRNIAQCAAVATVDLSGAGAPVAGEVYVADRSGNAEAVFVDTNTSAGAAADRAFRLVVVC